MMDPLGWNLVLFVGKWVFTGMVFFILGMVLAAVRRELAFRVNGQPVLSPASPGRLRVVRAGTDDGYEPGMLLDLSPVTRLGKEGDNDLVLHDSYVSRHHARLYWDGAGWWVEDLASKNGTLVNGQACPERVPQALTLGNKLGIGGMVFELVD